MRFSDLVPFTRSIYQLEEGHGKRNLDKYETTVIHFAGSETELGLRKYKDDKFYKVQLGHR